MASLHIFEGPRWATRSASAMTRAVNTVQPWARPTARVIWALSWAVALAGSFAASFWFFLRTPAGQDLGTETFWRLAPSASGPGAWLATMPAMAPLVILGIGVCGVAGATVLLVRAVGVNRAIMRGVGVTLMVIVTYLVALILRDAVLLAPQATITTMANTFPSLEVVLMVALGAAALLMVPGRKLPWVIGFAILIVTQSVLIVAINGSQPSDALGGILLGASMGALTTALFLPTADLPADDGIRAWLTPPIAAEGGGHSRPGAPATWDPQDPASSYLFEPSGTTPGTGMPVLSTPELSWEVDMWAEIRRIGRD